MIIPVLDLKNGIAVCGKSGNRDSYRPLNTLFHDSPSPLEIAKNLKNSGASTIYIADLDAIERNGSNLEIIKDINKKHVSVMLDCGVSNIQDVGKALEAADKVIVATETLQNMGQLYQIFDSFSKDVIISIDIKDGELYTKHLNLSLDEFIPKIKKLDPDGIIILDISRVGLEKGFNMDLVNKIRGTAKSIIIGGGIRESDILKLQSNGIDKFLVGSALHKGKLKL